MNSNCAASLNSFALELVVHGVKPREELALGELEGIGVELGETDGFGDGVLAGVGFSAGFFIATPLFQINLLPCLMQVYLIFETVLVVPSLGHLVPVTAPFAKLIGKRATETVIANILVTLRI